MAFIDSSAMDMHMKISAASKADTMSTDELTLM